MHMDMAAAGAREHAAASDHSHSYLHTPSFDSSYSADSAPAFAPPAQASPWPPPPPPPPPPWHLPPASVTGFAVAHSLQAAASIHGDQLSEFNGRSVRVEHLHVHLHTPHAVGSNCEEYLRSDSQITWPCATATAYRPGDGGGGGGSSGEPSFALASCAEGINFGRKFAKGFYRAVKHVDERRHLLTYTQSPSTAQSLLLGLSLGLSTKREKHAIFVFDAGPPQHLAHAWPLHIHLREIVSLIQSLGPAFEYTRAKVKKNHFSLYMFGIKQRGTRFSSEGMQTWAAISYWAHNLPDSTESTTISSFLSSLGSSRGASF